MFREGLRPPNPFRERPPLEAALTQDGMSLKTLAGLSPVLVVCLPSLDAARNLLREVAARRRALEGRGLRLALVHMAGDEDARAALEPFDLHYVARVSDPARRLYSHFGLGEEEPGLLGRLRRQGPAQLPGAFLLRGGEVVGGAGATTVRGVPDLAALT